MSGDGSPEITVDGSGLRVAVVAARWHHEVMDGLLEGPAGRSPPRASPTWSEVRVPGPSSCPLAAARLARQGFDAVVTLGVVIRGGTRRTSSTCATPRATQGLTQVAVTTGSPSGSASSPSTTRPRRCTARGPARLAEDKAPRPCSRRSRRSSALREVAPLSAV